MDATAYFRIKKMKILTFSFQWMRWKVMESVPKEISGRSVEIIQPLRTMPYGKEFYVADTDGHVIAFLG